LSSGIEVSTVEDVEAAGEVETGEYGSDTGRLPLSAHISTAVLLPLSGAAAVTVSGSSREKIFGITGMTAFDPANLLLGTGFELVAAPIASVTVAQFRPTTA
jgi:hypothetical protein